MATFGMAFKNLNNLSADKLDKVIRGASFELFKNIVYGTPVDSGRAKNNWILTIDNVSDDKSDIADKTGNKAIQKASLEINKKLGKYIYIQNNLDYILKLEYGWSKQAPQGFVRQNILRMNQLIKKAIK